MNLVHGMLGPCRGQVHLQQQQHQPGNRVLRRIFGPKRDEVTRELSKLYNEELDDLYCSPNVLRVIKSRK